MSVNNVALSITNTLINPFIEIFGSLLIGFLLGIILAIVLRKLKGHDDYQVILLVAIGIGVGFSKLLGLSPLLTNIMLGTTLVNSFPRSVKEFNSINNFVPAFYVLFFTLAGASLDLSIFKTIGIVGIVYVFARGLGKYLGSLIGSLSVKAEENVIKYLGLGLLPQGGVSIGLSVLVRQQLPEYATVITTIIMFNILIYETTGPIFAKIAISKSGEINGIDNYLGYSLEEDVINDQEPTVLIVIEGRKR